MRTCLGVFDGIAVAEIPPVDVSDEEGESIVMGGPPSLSLIEEV